MIKTLAGLMHKQTVLCEWLNKERILWLRCADFLVNAWNLQEIASTTFLEETTNIYNFFFFKQFCVPS